MNERVSKVFILVLVAGMFASGVTLYLQDQQLSSLQAGLEQQRLHIESLQSEIAEQEVRLSGFGTLLGVKQQHKAASATMRALPSGIYVLTTDVAVDSSETEANEYTIYNFVLDTSVGAVKRTLHFGYASSGYFTHVIYFDQDSDGYVDVEMMKDFAKSIPGLGLATDWLIDSDHAQTVYDVFRLDVESAEMIDVNEVSSDANQQVERLWIWLNEQSDDLTQWVEDAVATE